MFIVNVLDGSPVYITDLKIKIGQDPVPIDSAKALASIDLRRALEAGMVKLEPSASEPQTAETAMLSETARAAESRRQGKILFGKLDAAIKGNQPQSEEVPIRAAVLPFISNK